MEKNVYQLLQVAALMTSSVFCKQLSQTNQSQSMYKSAADNILEN